MKEIPQELILEQNITILKLPASLHQRGMKPRRDTIQIYLELLGDLSKIKKVLFFFQRTYTKVFLHAFGNIHVNCSLVSIHKTL